MLTRVRHQLRNGYEAIDYNEMARNENLQPIELDMRKVRQLFHLMCFALSCAAFRSKT